MCCNLGNMSAKRVVSNMFKMLQSHGTQRAGLYAGWELLFVRTQSLLIENIKLNVRTYLEKAAVL